MGAQAKGLASGRALSSANSDLSVRLGDGSDYDFGNSFTSVSGQAVNFNSDVTLATKNTVTTFDNEKLAKIVENIGLDTEEGREIYNILRHVPADEIQQNVRASQLVKQWLTPEEWAMLKKDHKVIIKSKKYEGREYHVPESPSARVELYEDGVKIATLCGIVYSDRQTHKNFAQGDQLLTKIMAIKNDEDYYLEHSNRFDNYLARREPNLDSNLSRGSGRWICHNNAPPGENVTYHTEESHPEPHVNAAYMAGVMGTALVGAMGVGGISAMSLRNRHHETKKKNKASLSFLKKLSRRGKGKKNL